MNKLNTAYKSIGEVADLLNLKNSKDGKLNTHTLRFWEKTFSQIKPKFFNSKRRYYDQKTIDILRRIQFLLKEEGMTIKGVKKLLNNNSLKLDDSINKTINANEKNLKFRISKISNIIKDIKKIK